jgi:predicted ATP-grasp superfamily ATP-dependent carboligase
METILSIQESVFIFQQLYYVVQEAIAQYLNRADVNSVLSLGNGVAALERQYQKSVKLL